jgi:hypothetical protein
MSITVAHSRTLTATITKVGGGSVSIAANAGSASVQLLAAIKGDKGDKGDTGTSGAGYIHTQDVPSATWTITHNLGFRPDVSVTDSAGTEVEGGVAHPTINQTVITFSGGFSGFARLT